MGVEKALEAFGHDYVVRALVDFFFFVFGTFFSSFLEPGLMGLYESSYLIFCLSIMMCSSLAVGGKKNKL